MMGTGELACEVALHQQSVSKEINIGAPLAFCYLCSLRRFPPQQTLAEASLIQMTSPRHAQRLVSQVIRDHQVANQHKHQRGEGTFRRWNLVRGV